MKTIFTIFISFFLAKGCSSQNGDIDQASVVYEAFSRGFFKSIIIQNKKVYTINERDGERQEVLLSDKEWKELVETFKDIKLDEMAKMKAPTDKRTYDGAMHANVTITINGKTYTTPGFDHQYPPKGIQKFINKIVSLTFVE
jgi:hypothetical protein